MTRPARVLLICSILFGGGEGALGGEIAVVDVVADPPAVHLSGYHSVYSLLIHGKTRDGRLVDLTRSARFQSLHPQVADVQDGNVVRAVSDGSSIIRVEAAGKTLTVSVQVEQAARARPFHFENDIIPLLSKFRCNSSGCHGKAEGQNGFRLSVFGFDPEADFAALTKEGRGRRIFPAAPENSLVLRKVSGGVPHGGGVRIPRKADEYQTIRGWIAAGAPFGDAEAPTVVSIRIEPAQRLLSMGAEQQLRVVARYSDGHEADVTRHTKFQSNNDGLATVDDKGLVSAGSTPGEVAIMAGFMGPVAVFQALIPRAPLSEAYPTLAEANFIDTLVFAKLRKLNILPSEPATDAEFLRRVYLDVIGTLPMAAEARRFLCDPRAERRALLVDELLARPEFADYWALKWADLLRVDRQVLGPKHAYAYYKWIRDSLAANKPLDQFARELLISEGPLDEAGTANFYKVANKPGDAANTISQVFLGVRIACAECHHHPFDRWSQSDYYGMQAFFTQVEVKKTGGAEMVVLRGTAATKHPRTGATIMAHPLGTAMPATAPAGDRRQLLAEWMTAPDNPWFARNLVNRTWAHFLGRGLVEPVDDVRATNPPTNPELLDALARHLIEARFDFRQLIRTITASRVYQLSSRPNATNETDEQNYSRAPFKRIDAEVLLDMVCQTTGVSERFPGMPAGTRAIQLWDSKVPHYFLKLFGRPVRLSACECERNQQPGVAQVLHLMNGPDIHAKLTHVAGYLARIVDAQPEDRPLVDDLYLTFFSRYPTEAERGAALEYLGKEHGRRRQAAEDLAWGMMNSVEFIFNH
jgi:hypothetical protein